ncbi:MAG: hypothetical protein ABIG66_00725 [Candidatus Kerfeldbacteria bacterium]
MEEENMPLRFMIGRMLVELPDDCLAHPGLSELLDRAGPIHLELNRRNLDLLASVVGDDRLNLDEPVLRKLWAPAMDLIMCMPGTNFLKTSGITHVFQLVSYTSQELADLGALPRVVTDLSYELRSRGLHLGLLTKAAQAVLALRLLRERLNRDTQSDDE